MPEEVQRQEETQGAGGGGDGEKKLSRKRGSFYSERVPFLSRLLKMNPH